MTIALETSSAAAAGRSDPRRSRLSAFLVRHRVVIYAFLASRLALLAVGLMTQIFIEPFSSHVSTLHMTEQVALRMWGQWDTAWYGGIATEGYSRTLAPGAHGQANWAFFPAFPMISGAIAKLAHLPVLGAMVLLSNLSFLAALILAHRFAREEFDERTADVAVVLLCAAPGSYILSSAYTESLFLLAVTGCLLMLRARRWLAAGAFAGLAVLTRNLGMGLVLPFAFAAAPGLWVMAQDHISGRTPSRRPLLVEATRVAGGLALPLLALAGFCLLLYVVAGDPLAFVTAQKGWGRHIGDPLAKLYRPVVTGKLANIDVVSFAAAWLSMAMLVTLAAMRRWSLLILGAFLTLMPLATGLTSYARYSLVALPVFLAGARLLAPRPNAATAALIVFATINGFLMVAWTLGMDVTV